MARKANGASSSLRFSARLKCTRPTRFHAGFRRFRKSCIPHFDSASSTPNAASSSCQRAPRTSAVRYSAPVMGGAARTSRSNSAAGGAGTCTFRGARIGIREGAEGRHVPCAEFSPVGEDRRKRGSDFSRAELQKTMARSARERVPQPLSKLGIEGRRVRGFD